MLRKNVCWFHISMHSFFERESTVYFVEEFLESNEYYQAFDLRFTYF